MELIIAILMMLASPEGENDKEVLRPDHKEVIKIETTYNLWDVDSEEKPGVDKL